MPRDYMSNCRVVDFKGRVDIVESSAYWIFSSEVKFKSRVRTCICCVAMFKTLALCDGTPKCYVLYLSHMLWIASALFSARCVSIAALSHNRIVHAHFGNGEWRQGRCLPKTQLHVPTATFSCQRLHIDASDCASGKAANGYSFTATHH